jgi:hypothetical protein
MTLAHQLWRCIATLGIAAIQAIAQADDLAIPDGINRD